MVSKIWLRFDIAAVDLELGPSTSALEHVDVHLQVPDAGSMLSDRFPNIG